MTIGLEQVVVLLQSSQNIASTTDVCLVLWDAFDEIDAASPRPAFDSLEELIIVCVVHGFDGFSRN
jgi:hypothetical protein